MSGSVWICELNGDTTRQEEEMLAKALELSRMAVEAPVMDSAAAIGSTSADSTDADSTPPAKKSRKEPVDASSLDSIVRPPSLTLAQKTQPLHANATPR